MKILKKIVIVLLGIIILLALGIRIFGPGVVHNSYPQVDGEIQVPGLLAPVEVIRDDAGVPQIYASNEHDLFFAQGYVHAQDRFWQMDFWRHKGGGEVSAMLGKNGLEADLFLNTIGWRRIAEEEVRLLDPDSLSVLESYSEGVNAYLAEHKGSALSLEYVFLKLLNRNYQPEPWTPVNTLTWGKAMAWDLRGNMSEEIERAILLKTLSPDQVDQISPTYPQDRPTIVTNFPPVSSWDTNTPKGSNQTESWSQSLSDTFHLLQDRIAAVDSYLGGGPEGLGSNSWAVSGSLTETGKPILANDPHLTAQIPSIWYQVGLHCKEESPQCRYDVAGFSFAGVPGIVIGHNNRIAWGFTNVGPDVMDLFIEKINPENPNQYEFNGKWVDMELVTETIQVAGGDPVELTVRITRHGPIISDAYEPVTKLEEKTNLSLPEHYAIALRWTALEPGNIFQSIWGMNRAQNWEEFRKAASYFDVPAQNLLYADVDGNIGYQMPGKIPVRKKGDGSLPVPGWTDEYEWQGTIPFEELPYAFNPPEGFIVTANNAVVGPDYPYLISLSWANGFRAQRIVDMIQKSATPISVDDIKAMQYDALDLNAVEIVPYLMQVDLPDSDLEQVRELFSGWDYQMGMDSAPAALYAVFWKNLLAETFQDDLPVDYYPNGGSRWMEVVRQLVKVPDSFWWDDKTTQEIETRDRIFSWAFQETVTEIRKDLGKKTDAWKWGDLHTITFKHDVMNSLPLINALFNQGPFRTAGGSSIVNATGWDASKDYQVKTVPSMRMIVDLSDLKNSLTVHTTGQSGHARHAHYIDLANHWRNGEYYPMVWELNQIKAAASNVLQLLPK